MIKSTEPGAHAAGSPHGVGYPQRFAACRRRRAERRGRRCGRPRSAAQAEGAQGRAAGAPVRASTGRARACTASVAPARRGPAAAVALHGAACALAQRPAAGRRPPLGRTSTIFRRRGTPFATPWAAPRAVGPDASGQCASFTRLREPLPCLHTSADAGSICFLSASHLRLRLYPLLPPPPRATGHQPRACAAHPTQSLVAVAHGASVMELDAATGARLGCAPMQAPCVRLAYAPRQGACVQARQCVCVLRSQFAI